ncbi:hypothetical protein [Lysinibacillus sp. UGB7]|uniref:hypothetical protein n=1 Tax=Lysinibacillus sp. UGB7 TaxID=3411039 RepID=UPI003BA195CB
MGIFELFSKPKPKPKSKEDVLIERAFSRKNVFVDVLNEICEWSPGRKKLRNVSGK